MEALPDLSAMDKQALASLVMELYERSCKVFGATFDIQHQVRVGCSYLKKINIVNLLWFILETRDRDQ